MTNERFFFMLRGSSIPELSKDLKDYEEAKRMVVRFAETSEDYERLLRAAQEYVGV